MTITNSVATKLSVAAVAIAMMFAFVITPAKAQTTADLQAQIATLMAQINALQAQLGVSGSSSSSMTSSVCPYTWTRSLKAGSNGMDVMKLQQFLNSNPATQVAASGVGSAGKETQYYGPATGAAVKKFQEMYRTDILSPLGLVNATTYFGPATMAKANALCVAAPTTGSTGSTTGTTTTTGSTGSTGSSATLGHNSGSIDTVTQTAADDSQIREGATTGLFAFQTKINGDVQIDRVDIYAYNAGSGSTIASKYFTSASLWADGNKVASQDVSNWTSDYYNAFSAGTAVKQYRIRFENLGLVYKDGQTPNFQVAMTANNVIDSANNTANWKIGLITGSIRYIDGTGFSDSTTESFSSSFSTQASLNAKLSVVESANTPAAGTVQVSDVDTTRNVPIAMYDVTEKNGVAVTINDLQVMVKAATSSADGASISDIVRTVSLWDGSTQLSSKAVPATNASSTIITFDNMSYKLAANGTASLTVKVDFAQRNQTSPYNYANGDTVTASFYKFTDMTDANNNDQTTIQANSADADAMTPVNGETQTIRSTGLNVTMTSQTGSQVTDANSTANNYGNYTMNFSVTAFGDTLYIPLSAGRGTTTQGLNFDVTDANGNVVNVATGTVTASLSKVSGGQTTSGNNVMLGDGQTATFQATVTFNPGTSGQYRIQANGIGYNTIDSRTGVTQQTVSPASSYQTSNVFVSN